MKVVFDEDLALSAHGLAPLNPSGSINSVFNKLVSNRQMRKLGMAVTDSVFPKIAPTSGGAVVKVIDVRSTALTTEYTAVWIASGGMYYADVTHYMDLEAPLVTVWDKPTRTVIMPVSIDFISNTRCRIWMLTNNNSAVTIAADPGIDGRARTIWTDDDLVCGLTREVFMEFLDSLEACYLSSSSSSRSSSSSSSRICFISSSSVSSSSSSSSSSLSSSSSSSSLSSSSSSSSSSLSSSSSSSSTCSNSGDLTLIDTDDQGGDYRGVWCDGNFIYTGCGGDGLRSYSVNVSGGLIPIDTDFNTNSVQVYGDGSYIYVTCSTAGLMSYLVDGVGNLTFADKIKDSTFSFWNDVWADVNFIYTVNSGTTGSGLRVYQTDGFGNLSFVSVHYAGGAGYFRVWGDGNFIYCACATSGLRSYSVDGGGNLTHRDVDDQGGTYFDVWGDGNFIYVTTTDGIRSYSVDGSGNLTFISLIGGDPGFQDSRIWGDGTFIYATSSNGIRSYSVDGSGNLTFIDSDGTYKGYGVWGDGTFIYTAGGTSGIRSYQVDDCS